MQCGPLSIRRIFFDHTLSLNRVAVIISKILLNLLRRFTAEGPRRRAHQAHIGGPGPPRNKGCPAYFFLFMFSFPFLAISLRSSEEAYKADLEEHTKEIYDCESHSPRISLSLSPVP